VAYNFVAGDRDQLMLMPPSVADWLPEDHLAWFMLDVVAELDLSAFHAAYRSDGRGGAAYDPQLMLAVLIYAYAGGERSSRRIERRLVEDVAFRVVAANQQPDHATGRARQLSKIAEVEAGRTAVLDRVAAGQIDTREAAEQLGVTRARVNQLLRRRRAGEPDPLTTTMSAKLATPRGRRTYKKRAATIEPIFGQIKHNRQIRSLSRRGLAAVASEWKLICTTHNLLKLSRLA